MTIRIAVCRALIALALGFPSSTIEAQSKAAKPAPPKIDDEYTRTIRANLQDPRITTELVDHLPASDTLPSPLKFLGRAVGAPGELTYTLGFNAIMNWNDLDAGKAAPGARGTTNPIQQER